MKSNENMFDRIFYKTKFSTIHHLIQIVFIFLIFYNNNNNNNNNKQKMNKTIAIGFLAFTI